MRVGTKFFLSKDEHKVKVRVRKSCGDWDECFWGVGVDDEAVMSEGEDEKTCQSCWDHKSDIFLFESISFLNKIKIISQ